VNTFDSVGKKFKYKAINHKFFGTDLMQANVRAAVAYISGRLISGKSSSDIYDYFQGKHIPISGTVNRGRVQVFDYDDGAHISGNGNGQSYSLFHYGQNSHISLTISGHNFKGYDYGAGSHFTGNVSGNQVSFFDYSEGTYFSFAI
jgi:hypothetical protein